MDDEPLDLAVWSAPPAPRNLADRVIARVNATDEAIAITQRRRAKRRWLLAGGLAGALTAAAIAMIVIERGTAPNGDAAGSGTTVAIQPQHLVLADAVANLDPGTEVSWQQSAGAIHIQQRSGAATWRVDASHLFIGVGAAVASIEATHATLRVETRMNFADTRLIGAVALTSAAVAVVTVVVYEGQAKVSSAGQTVVVQPGITYDVTPGHAPTQRLDDVDRALDRVLELTSSGTPKVTPAPPPAKPVEKNEPPPPPPALTPAQIDAVMHVVEPMLTKCIAKPEPDQTVSFEIAPDGTASKVSSSLKDRKAKACIEEIVTHVRFPSNVHATLARYKIATACNPDDLLSQGTAAVARGEHVEALKSYDAALKCKFDIHSLQLAFMAACRAQDVNAARRYWKRMDKDMQSHLLQMCVHEHIGEEQLDE